MSVPTLGVPRLVQHDEWYDTEEGKLYKWAQEQGCTMPLPRHDVTPCVLAHAEQLEAQAKLHRDCIAALTQAAKTNEEKAAYLRKHVSQPNQEKHGLDPKN